MSPVNENVQYMAFHDWHLSRGTIFLRRFIHVVAYMSGSKWEYTQCVGGEEVEGGDSGRERLRALGTLTCPVSGWSEPKDALYFYAVILVIVAHGPMNNRIN